MLIDHQIDEEMILIDEISDEALEAAALVTVGGFPTLPHTYCFACPSAGTLITSSYINQCSVFQNFKAAIKSGPVLV